MLSNALAKSRRHLFIFAGPMHMTKLIFNLCDKLCDTRMVGTKAMLIINENIM